LLVWVRANARDLPWRRTRDPYAIWISEVMLQQTQVQTVIPYWERWMRELPNVRALAAAPDDRVLKLWEGLGYYTRARNLHRAAQAITLSDAPFPQDFDTILALPGVGRYTAGAICSIALNQPKPVLDGNVIRVFTRFFGIGACVRERKVNEHLWQIAEKLVIAVSGLADSGSSNCSHLNQALMELGATVCTPRQPRCGACPLRGRCVARSEHRLAELPNLGARAASAAREVHAFVLESKARVWLRQRTAGGVNSGLWEFPNVEAVSIAAAVRRLDLRGGRVKPLCEVRHSITRYRIRMRVWHLSGDDAVRNAIGNGRWFSQRQADRLALAAAHRKALWKFCLWKKSNGH
jgi:A/G-specific adenine glycosylase